MTKFDTDIKLEALLLPLNEDEKDALYRKLQYVRVLKDLKTLAADKDAGCKALGDAQVEEAARQYAYGRRYGCSQPYWDSLWELLTKQAG